MKKILVFIVVVITLASCSGPRYYHQRKKFKFFKLEDTSWASKIQKCLGGSCKSTNQRIYYSHPKWTQ